MSGRPVIAVCLSVISGELLAPVTSLSKPGTPSSYLAWVGSVSDSGRRGVHRGSRWPFQPLNGTPARLDQTALTLHVSRIHSPRSSPCPWPSPCRPLRTRYCRASRVQPPAASSSPRLAGFCCSPWLSPPNIESDIPHQGHRLRHEASKPRALSPRASQPGSGLPALSLAPHHHATPCVWPARPACFGLA